VDQINRIMTGPPFDFNNTLFEFMAVGTSAREAEARADGVLDEAILSECGP
jgi:hypothetical protein